MLRLSQSLSPTNTHFDLLVQQLLQPALTASLQIVTNLLTSVTCTKHLQVSQCLSGVSLTRCPQSYALQTCARARVWLHYDTQLEHKNKGHEANSLKLVYILV